MDLGGKNNEMNKQIDEYNSVLLFHLSTAAPQW